MTDQEERIAKLEEQVANLEAKTKPGEQMSAIEKTRQRLFGYAREGMASEGGKIVG